jgi:hypothetical protein
VLQLGLDLDHPNSCMELLESYSPECLHSNVSELVLSADELSTNTALLNTLPHIVISHTDVLAALMKDRVLQQCEGGFVVHPQLNWLGLLLPQICEKPCQPDSLSCCRRRSDILCFARRHCNTPLLERIPAYQARVEEEQHVGGVVAIVDVAGVITVVVADQFCSSLPAPVEAAVVNHPRNIMEHPLQRHHMLCRRPLHKAAQIAHSVDQVWAGVHQISQAADEVAIECCIFLLCFAVAAQFESLLVEMRVSHIYLVASSTNGRKKRRPAGVAGVIGPHRSPWTRSSGAPALNFAFAGNEARRYLVMMHVSQPCFSSITSSPVTMSRRFNWRRAT